MEEDLRKLKDEAARAFDRRAYRKSSELYAKVAKHEPDEPRWSQRVGEALKLAGEPLAALQFFATAADVYAKQGFLLKAIAMAKLILQLDPHHAETQANLASLYARSDDQETPALGMPAIDELSTAPSLSLSPDEPIAALPLSEVISTAHRSGRFQVGHEIPLAEAEHRPQRLPPTPLFSALSEPQLRQIIERLRHLQCAAGQVIVREGEHGSSLYVVVHGEAEVRVAGLDEPLGRLGEGSFFGELAVLTNLPRLATVAAVTDCELLEIDRATIARLLEEDVSLLPVMLRFFRDRLLERLMATSPLFRSFSGDDARKLAARFQFLELDAGTVLVRQGERASGLFVLLCGECEINKEGRVLPPLGPGDLIGEISLLRRIPATATVRTRSRVWALGLGRADFQELILTHPQVLIYVDDLVAQRLGESGRVQMI